MDQDRRKRRTLILMAIAVFAMICSFWAVFPLGMQAYRTYRLKTKLRSFQMPPETEVLTINTEQAPNATLVTVRYGTHLPCEKVKSHYKTEFARHGFSYTGEGFPPGTGGRMHFCATPYSVDLGWPSTDFCTASGPSVYLISIYEVGAC